MAMSIEKHQKPTHVECRKVGTVVIVKERKAHSPHDKGYLFGVFADMRSAQEAYGPIDPAYDVAFEQFDVMQLPFTADSVSRPLHSIVRRGGRA